MALERERIFVVTPMKDEGPFILEWVAHNIAIGATDIVIFSNDCTDGSDKLLDRLAKLKVIHHFDNSSPRPSPQRRAYRRFLQMDLAKADDWVVPIDADEFINVKVGDHRLPDLFDAIDGAKTISMTWRLFGNGDVRHYQEGFLTDQFVKAARENTPRPPQAWGMKTIFKRGMWDAIGVHRPKRPRPKSMEELKWVNGSGDPMPDRYYDKHWRSMKDSVGYDLVQLNHYALKSAESYLVKKARGRAHHTADSLGLEYWNQMNQNACRDVSIDAVRQAKVAIFEELMSDNEIASLHANCCSRHKDMAVTLQQDEKFADLAQKLGLSRLATSEQPDGESAAAAPWLKSLSPGGDGKGFLKKLESHAVALNARPSDRLVVSFDNLSEVNNDSIDREPWGGKFIADEGYAHLSVFSGRKSWYRDQEVIDCLTELSKSPEITQYKKVSLIGASMGGFAALAFAPLFPGATVVSFNPQTTLDPKRVPWEERYRFGQKQDWSLPMSDASAGAQHAARAYIFYDHFFVPDRNHALMVQGKNVTHLKCWFSDHYAAPLLRRLDLLKPTMRAAIEGTLEPHMFYEAFRIRRSLPRYFHALEKKAREGKHDKLLVAAQKRFTMLRKAQVAEK